MTLVFPEGRDAPRGVIDSWRRIILARCLRVPSRCSSRGAPGSPLALLLATCTMLYVAGCTCMTAFRALEKVGMASCIGCRGILQCFVQGRNCGVVHSLIVRVLKTHHGHQSNAGWHAWCLAGGKGLGRWDDGMVVVVGAGAVEHFVFLGFSNQNSGLQIELRVPQRESYRPEPHLQAVHISVGDPHRKHCLGLRSESS